MNKANLRLPVHFWPAISLSAPYLFVILAALSIIPLAPGQAIAADKIHKVAVHVDRNDRLVMKMALNNIENLVTLFESRGEKVLVELVAYGPGLHMLRADTSPVKDRIEIMSLAIPDLKFSACANTMRLMKQKSGKDVPLIEEASSTPSGVVRLIELQERGYAYIKP